MLTLYTWTTPNGWKASIALEEMGLPYEVKPIDIMKDDQFTPEFLALNPNNKIPVIVDDDGTVVFESGAILLYLGRKTGQFLPPENSTDYWEVLQWLMWQVGGFGPMLGQAHHFLHFNKGVSDYAEQRYAKESRRLYSVLEKRLAERLHLAGELSVADFAVWPWVSRFRFQRIDLNDYPAVHDWYLRLAEREGFQRGVEKPHSTGPIPMPGG